MFSLLTVRLAAQRFLPTTARPILSRPLFSSHLQTRSFLSTAPRLLATATPKPKSKPKSKPATPKSEKTPTKRKLAAKKKPAPKKKKKAPVKKKRVAKKKKPVDKNARLRIPVTVGRPPLGHVTPYVLYIKEWNNALPAAKSLATMNERLAIAGPQWRALSAAEKQPYVELANQLAKQRSEERAKWFEKTDRRFLREINKRRRARGKPRLVAPKDPNAPKKVPSTFVFYVADFRKTPHAVGVGNRDILKRASEHWHALSDAEKQVYSDRRAKALAAQKSGE